MKLYPSEMLTIEIPEPTSAVLERLHRAVEAPRGFRRSHDHPPFEGWIRGDRFEINRIIHYRNSFLPIIEGQIVPLNGHTLIHARIAVLWAFVAMTYALLLLLAGAGIAILHTDGDVLLLTGSGFFFVLFTAIIYFSGWSEIRIAKRLLREALLPSP